MLRVRRAGQNEDSRGTATRPPRKRFVVVAGQPVSGNLVLRDAGKTWLSVAVGAAIAIGVGYFSGWSPMPDHQFPSAYL